MEQENKSTGKVANDPKNLIFVKASDFTESMFKTLPRIKAVLKKTISKKGYTRCSLDIEIDKTFLSVSIQLTEVRFNYLRLKMGLETFDKSGREIYEYPFLVPFRFIKGQNSLGEYKSVEVILGQKLSETYFFNDSNEVGTLDILEADKRLKITWEARPDKLDVTDTLNSSWDN